MRRNVSYHVVIALLGAALPAARAADTLSGTPPAPPAMVQGVHAAERLDEVTRLRTELGRLASERRVMSNELSVALARISRLKLLPAAEQDRLPGEMASAQALGRKLTGLEATLSEKQKQLVAKIDALSADPKTDDVLSAKLIAWRAEAALLPSSTRTGATPNLAGVLEVAERPEDGPEELRQKADLLQDARAKVVAELGRLGRRQEVAKRRTALLRGMRSLESTPFVEESRTRVGVFRTGSPVSGIEAGGAVKSSAQAEAPRASQDSAAHQPSAPAGAFGGTPTPGSANSENAPPSSPGTSVPGPLAARPSLPTQGPSDAPGITGSTGQGLTADLAALKDFLDADTLADLRQPRDSAAYVQAIERAKKQLESIATDLDKRSRMLRKRADELLHTP